MKRSLRMLYAISVIVIPLLFVEIYWRLLHLSHSLEPLVLSLAAGGILLTIYWWLLKRGSPPAATPRLRGFFVAFLMVPAISAAAGFGLLLFPIESVDLGIDSFYVVTVLGVVLAMATPVAMIVWALRLVHDKSLGSLFADLHAGLAKCFGRRTRTRP